MLDVKARIQLGLTTLERSVAGGDAVVEEEPASAEVPDDEGETDDG